MDVRDDRDAHRRRGTLPKLLIAGSALALWATAGALLWRTQVPALDLPRLDPAGLFDAALLERIGDFRRVSRALLLGSLAVELLALGAVVLKARALAALLRRRLGGDVRTGVAVGLVAVLVVWLAELPLDAVAHWWRRRYGLSLQGYGGWLGDEVIALTVQAVLVSLAVAGAMLLARRLGRRWWLAGAPALALAAVLFVVLQPLVIQPLSNRFRPLEDRSLARQVERLAAREGVEVDDVLVADASRRTTTANAFVAGIGPTRRVVLDDTLLDGRFTHAEILSVAAHELAHVGRRHLWKGTAWFALLAIPGLALVAFVTERSGGLRDPALVPLGLFLALVVYLGTLPLQNGVSRRYEAEADWLALRATGDAGSAIRLEKRFVATSLGDPEPPAWVTLWFGTHPDAVHRIAMARAFSDRARGGS